MTQPIASCLNTRSQHEVQLLDYLRTLQKRADERLMPGRDDRVPRYYEDRPPRTVYVWPDVIKTVRHERPNRSDNKDQEPSESDRSYKPGSSLPGVATEPSHDDPRRYDDEYTTERVPWLQVVERAASQHRPFRALILGIAGQGKSWLTQMTTAKLADQAYQTLDAFTDGPTDLKIPICLRLPDLVDRCQGLKGDEKKQAIELSDHIEAMLVADGCGPHVARFLAQRLLPEADNPVGTVPWLLLDALDEVANDKRSALDHLLQTMDQWPSPIVVTGRPWAKEKIPLGLSSWQEHTVFELAAFTPQQSQSLAQKWFAGDSSSASDMFCDRLRQGGYRALAKVPLFLTQLCAIADRDGAARLPEPEQVTSGALYGHILEELFGELPAPDPGAGDTHLKISFQRLSAVVYYLAWRMTCRPNTSIPWIKEVDALKRIRESITEQQLDLKPDAVLATLVKARLLVPENSNHGASFVFSHRDLGAYLAGAHLAEVVNEEGWECQPAVQSPQPNRVYRVRDWLCAAIWDPNTEPVVAYALGEIKYGMAGPILEALEAKVVAQPDGEILGQDVVCYRLTALARCFRQIRVHEEDDGPTLDDATSAVLERTRKRYLDHLCDASHLIFYRSISGPLSDQALDALLEATLRHGGLNDISQKLLAHAGEKESDWSVRHNTCEVLGQVGATLGHGNENTQHIIKELLLYTGTPKCDEVIQGTACEALGRIAATSALEPGNDNTQLIIDALLALAGNERKDLRVRGIACEVLGHIAATYGPESENIKRIINALLAHACENVNRSGVRQPSYKALGHIAVTYGPESECTQDIINAMLEDAGEQMGERWDLYDAYEPLERIVVMLGPENGNTKQIVNVLLAHASERASERWSREAAYHALGRVAAVLGPRHKQIENIIKALLGRASKEVSDWSERSTACEALGRVTTMLGPGHEQMENIINALLAHSGEDPSNWSARPNACRALGHVATTLGPRHEQTKKIISILLARARTRVERYVQSAACEALGQVAAVLGPRHEQIEDIIKALLLAHDGYVDSDLSARSVSCEALGHVAVMLGPMSEQAESIISVLLARAGEQRKGAFDCYAACQALGHIAAAMRLRHEQGEKIIKTLLAYINIHMGHWVQRAGYEALDAIIARGIRLLNQQDSVLCIPLDDLVRSLCPKRNSS